MGKLKHDRGVALVEVRKLQIVPMNIAKSMKQARIIKTAANCKELWDWMKNTEYRKRLPQGHYAERFAGGVVRVSEEDKEAIKVIMGSGKISYRLKMRWKNFKQWATRKLRRRSE